MTTTLYRAFDDRDRLLYVGISDGPFIRMGEHAATSAWTAYAVKVTLERHVLRADAEAAERVAIATEDPVWNYMGRPTKRFLQWMKAYPDGDPDAVDTDEIIARTRHRI